jgi:hypothetical protein
VASFDARKPDGCRARNLSSRELAQLDRRVADEYFTAAAWAVDDPAKPS